MLTSVITLALALLHIALRSTDHFLYWEVSLRCWDFLNASFIKKIRKLATPRRKSFPLQIPPCRQLLVTTLLLGTFSWCTNLSLRTKIILPQPLISPASNRYNRAYPTLVLHFEPTIYAIPPCIWWRMAENRHLSSMLDWEYTILRHQLQAQLRDKWWLIEAPPPWSLQSGLT